MTTKSLGSILSGTALVLASCGGSSGGASAGVLTATSEPDAEAPRDGGLADGPLTTDPTEDGGGPPAPCGQKGQPCCMSGALCSAGLTCSDAYCLACGPAPAPFAGCVNAAVGDGVVASGGVYPVGAVPDDAHTVIDNDICSSWNYGYYGDDNAFWQVDLGQVTQLDAMTLWPKMTPADGQVRLSIQYRVHDTDAWISYPTAAGLSLLLHDYQPWETIFDPALTVRYFRITMVESPSFAALREVGLYAKCNRSIMSDGG